MASTSAVFMAMPLTHKKKIGTSAVPTSFFNPLQLTRAPLINSNNISSSSKGLVVKSSFKDNNAAVSAVITAAALTASMVVPEVAQAASSVSPSLNNFLLSIGAGGVVLGGILGAIIGVSNFDPVKRG